MTESEIYRTPYLDTSVYIAAIKGPTTEDPERVRISAYVLSEAEAGRLRIIASTFIHAEVIRDRGEEAPLDSAKETIVDDFLQHQFISWVELDVAGARLARQLARRYTLKPPDGVHLAAALRGKADVFFTWDERLITAVKGDVDGIPVREPFVAQGLQPRLDFFTIPVATAGVELPPTKNVEPADAVRSVDVVANSGGPSEPDESGNKENAEAEAPDAGADQESAVHQAGSGEAADAIQADDVVADSGPDAAADPASADHEALSDDNEVATPPISSAPSGASHGDHRALDEHEQP